MSLLTGGKQVGKMLFVGMISKSDPPSEIFGEKFLLSIPPVQQKT